MTTAAGAARGRGSAFDDGAPPPPDHLDLVGVLRAAVRSWWILAIAAVLGVGVAWRVYGLHTPTYRAAATIRIANSRYALAGSLADQSRDPEAPVELSPVLSKLEVLRSRSVAYRAAAGRAGAELRVTIPSALRNYVDQISLAPEVDTGTIRLAFGAGGVRAGFGTARATAPYGEPVEVGGVRFVVASRPDTAAAQIQVVGLDQATALILGNLVAKPRTGTDVVDVSLAAYDPHNAQRALDALLSSYRETMLEDARARLRERVAFVRERLRQNDSSLGAAQAALSAFRSRRRGGSTRDDINLLHGGLLSIEARRRELAGEQRLVSDALARSGTAGDGDDWVRTLAAVGADRPPDPVFLETYQGLVRAQAARDSMVRAPFARAATHPDVLRADALIAETRRKLRDLAHARVTGLTARIAELDRMAAQSGATLSELPLQEERELQLVTQTEQLARLSEQLRTEYERAEIAESAEWGSVEILDSASVGRREGVPLGQALGYGGALGTLVGLCGAGAREARDRSFRQREQIVQGLRVPELAVIPRAPLPGTAFGGRLLRRAPRHPGRPALPATLVDPHSAEAEAYRILRTNVLYAGDGGQRRVIAVTSPLPRDGKTTVSCNLAAVLATPQRRVLLIDADTRRPVVHRVFNLPAGPGLVERLTHGLPIEQLVRRTAVPGLDVLPAGVLGDAPPDLADGALADLLDEVSTRYPTVVVDTPPVLLMADAAVLAAHADGVVLVLRAGHTALAAGQQAMYQLASVNARVLGAVMNDPDKKARYEGYSAYYYTRDGAGAADSAPDGEAPRPAVEREPPGIAALMLATSADGAALPRGAGLATTTSRRGRPGPLAPASDSPGPASHRRVVRFGAPSTQTVEFLSGRLEIVGGPESGRDVRFFRQSGERDVEVTFGRNEGPPNRHVQLAADTVSRQHAVMAFAGGRWRLRNLSKTNPAALNGRLLALGELTPELSEGDQIEMGEVTFRFHER